MTTNRKNNKERTSTLFNRYVWLVETILRAGRITFEEINDKWNRSRLNYSGDVIPLRTFHNHRQAIEEMFDVTVTDVRTVSVPSKPKRRGYTRGRRPGWKKAIVELKPGEDRAV